MKYLVVVAHPDDEVLGAGAAIYKIVQSGNEVDLLIMSSQADARMFRPDDEDLDSDINSAKKILGISKIYYGKFPNIKMNTVPHIELVKSIEDAIIDSEPEVVITHHPSDTNNDHYHTSVACQAAIRLFQRRNNVKPIRDFLFMEVLSSTEWSVNTSISKFEPNTFVEVGKVGIDKKIEAMKQYRDVMRPYPHPRSVEAIEGLSLYRGAQSGCNYAEAFESVFRRI